MKYKALLIGFLLVHQVFGVNKPLAMRQTSAALSLGCSHLNTSAIQAFIPQQQRNFNCQQKLIGGQINFSNGKRIVGLSGSFAMGDRIQNDSFSYAMSGAFGSIDLAYLLHQTRKICFFPMLGLGSSAYGLGISRKVQLTQEQINKQQVKDIHINNGGLLADLSLNITFNNWGSNKKNLTQKQGLFAGIKMGYVYGLKNSSWRYTGGLVTEGPNYGMRMVYLKLNIGGFTY